MSLEVKEDKFFLGKITRCQCDKCKRKIEFIVEDEELTIGRVKTSNRLAEGWEYFREPDGSITVLCPDCAQERRLRERPLSFENPYDSKR